MAKIVRFPCDHNDVVSNIEILLEKAKTGEIESFVFAAKCMDGNVATSWAKADAGTRQELVGHIEVDIMMAVIEANFVTP